jgi:hypothetical protein
VSSWTPRFPHLRPPDSFPWGNPGRLQGLRQSVVGIDRQTVQKVVRSAVRRLKALNSKTGTFAICASIKNSYNILDNFKGRKVK